MICISFVLFRDWERNLAIASGTRVCCCGNSPRTAKFKQSHPVYSSSHIKLSVQFYFKPLFKTSLKVIKDEVRLIQVKRARSDNKIINYFCYNGKCHFWRALSGNDEPHMRKPWHTSFKLLRAFVSCKVYFEFGVARNDSLLDWRGWIKKWPRLEIANFHWRTAQSC